MGAVAQLGREARPIGVHSPGFVAKTDEAAREGLWPHYRDMFGRIGRERGWPPVTKDRFVAEVEQGSLYVGSPETVARKIAAAVRDLLAMALRRDRDVIRRRVGTIPDTLRDEWTRLSAQLRAARN